MAQPIRMHVLLTVVLLGCGEPAGSGDAGDLDSGAGCESDTDCDDSDPCTLDSCDPATGCSASLIDADGDDHAPMSLGSCGDDCDDSDASVRPGAEELCDGLDNDCDGTADENSPTWYVDCDADGFASSPAGSMVGCSPPAASATGCATATEAWTSTRPGDASTSDCADDDPTRNPDATEASACNGIDEDCDGTDDGVAGPCCVVAAECDDSNPCTTDACSEYLCASEPVVCPGIDACRIGVCDTGTGACGTMSLTCDDGDACTIDSCDGSIGCRHARTFAGACAGDIVRLSTGGASESHGSPAISGRYVVWMRTVGTTEDIVLHDLSVDVQTNLTAATADRAFLPDVEGDNVVWTQITGGRSGIVRYDVAADARTVRMHATGGYQSSAIHGRDLVYLRVTTQIDVELYDVSLGVSSLVTNDLPIQGRPRVGPSLVVYEDYASGSSDIHAHLFTPGPSFVIAGGAGEQLMPDIDGDWVVYVDRSPLGVEHVAFFDTTTRIGRTLTTVDSVKHQPRISGSFVVWADDRNGTLDLFLYDLTTNREFAIVTGPGDQYLPDIDGSRIVYTDDAAGYPQVYLLTLRGT